MEDKKRKRKQQYEKKKFTRYQERSRALRDATGVHGFVRAACTARLYGSGVSWWTALSGQAALYRVLGLNDRKLVRGHSLFACAPSRVVLSRCGAGQASEAEIRKAYKRKALQYHPDKLKPGDDPDKAAEMFDAVRAPPSDATLSLLTGGLPPDPVALSLASLPLKRHRLSARVCADQGGVRPAAGGHGERHGGGPHGLQRRGARQRRQGEEGRAGRGQRRAQGRRRLGQLRPDQLSGHAKAWEGSALRAVCWDVCACACGGLKKVHFLTHSMAGYSRAAIAASMASFLASALAQASGSFASGPALGSCSSSISSESCPAHEERSSASHWPLPGGRLFQ